MDHKHFTCCYLITDSIIISIQEQLQKLLDTAATYPFSSLTVHTCLFFGMYCIAALKGRGAVPLNKTHATCICGVRIAECNVDIKPEIGCCADEQQALDCVPLVDRGKLLHCTCFYLVVRNSVFV